MAGTRLSKGPVVLGVVVALTGLALLGGGGWLIALGGSWYYAAAGLGLLVTAGLLLTRRAAALPVYAGVVLCTLVWALWEVGLDWWPLAARGDVPVILGLLLLTPYVTRGLVRARTSEHRIGEIRPPSAFRGSGLVLTASLAVSVLVAGAALFTDPHRIDGTVPDARADVPADALGVPPGEWHAYGRTAHGQRWSPLDQITPETVSSLQEIWHYHTGDVRGPDDPQETTFQVTPLKIGNRLYLCTPHQSVIALDADTGEEIWRFDPEIRGELALQHLTCRGLSYYPGRPEGAPPETAAAPSAPAPATPATPPPTGAVAPPGGPVPASAAAPLTAELGLPQASAAPNTTARCPAKLFMPTADGRLIALDPQTGAVCTDFGDGGQINLWMNMPFKKPGGYYSTSPVVVTRDRIIVGGTVLDNVSTSEPSGVIRAFDLETGALLWNFDSGRPDVTRPLQPGETYTPNSPNSWSIMSVDEALGMVYVPLGNQPPDQWGGNRSPEVERFSSSVVALDLASGQVRWVFQTVHHDLWDYDVPSQPTLVDLTVNGETVPALVQPTKQGEIYVLDRRTGEPVLPVTETPAPQGAVEGDFTAPTQPVSALSLDPEPLSGASMWGATLFDQLACRIQFHRHRYEGRYTPPSLEGSIVYPGNFGVFNWGSIAVDPERQIAFITPTYLAFTSQLVPRPDDESLVVQGEQPQGALPALNENFGAPYAVKMGPLLSPLGLPCQAPPWGYVAAADLTTGEILWMHKNGTTRDASPIPLPLPMGVPNLGGPIVTAGGVAFLSGTIDYYVRGYDVRTGEELWKSRLPAGGQATPMTYTASDGRQVLLVVAGGHGSLGTKAGDSVIAYALPK
ncbi:glucose/quinate/shikimate family membrane-bound PQQ-dependent dehydrogenase [Chthonobacter rhizosphaerae]|uniref:glucose/quinate/shikimate family membrane-bound PQQ-dependent dehydrogenase n=1 Tax=Chthonobacter rhizosphaerae TaxID=2735553 RepID=UPI0015EF1E93|nr:glucose/quinate/shikimate family membrane-bound PQQ-dependent dehydrogenase [Chthonobacter rhizosphaerae]